MADTLSVVVRMYDQSRKAAVNLPGTLTIGQLVQTTQQKWNLSADRDYAIRLERTGEQLDHSATLNSVGVQPDDVLSVIPLIEAGAK